MRMPTKNTVEIDGKIYGKDAIVRCVNNFEPMLAAMKQIKASLDVKRYGDRKEGELEGYFALCDAIKEAEQK